jgi:N-acetylmuramoyl-L-alanine amidase
MRNVLILLAAGAAMLIVGAAVAQNTAVPAAMPASVDDLVAKILKSDDEGRKPPDSSPQAALPMSQPVKPAPVVMGVRIGEHPDRTRFVVEFSDPVAIRTFTLSNPNRVVIDLPEVAWKLSGPPKPSGHGAVRGYRYGPFRPDSSRFVIDLNKPVNVAEALVIPPENGFGYRVVIDLFPTDQAKYDRSAGWPADLAARERAAAKAVVAKEPPLPQDTGHKIVVLDPGHGGIDTGTSHNGADEKDIVLAAALQLKRTLAERGYKVRLTRDADVYVPLRQRVDMARAWHADLFVSIHADAIEDPKISGLSVYTLSEKSSDKEAARLAAKENRADVIAGVDLSGDNSQVAPILIDLAQRDTMNKSSRFAETLLTEVSQTTNILPRLPHRAGGLMVLKAPDVPSVLIELGYLSNVHDAEQMKTASWRKRVAAAIAAAIDRHFAGNKPAKNASVR